MMLGKRSRAPLMKRTTSMTGITTDSEGPRSLDPDQNLNVVVPELDHGHHHDHYHGRYSSSAFLSPRYYNNNNNNNSTRNSAALPNFMRTCGLCNRPLSQGRDIYMYRGDTAFCSQECREQQIKVDEGKEKHVAASKNVGSHRNHSELTSTAGSEGSSGKGETIAAA